MTYTLTPYNETPTKCETCGGTFQHGEMSHDDSGSYCYDCREAYEATMHAMYAPRSSRTHVMHAAPLYCEHGPTCELGEHCPTL